MLSKLRRVEFESIGQLHFMHFCDHCRWIAGTKLFFLVYLYLTELRITGKFNWAGLIATPKSDISLISKK